MQLCKGEYINCKSVKKLVVIFSDRNDEKASSIQRMEEAVSHTMRTARAKAPRPNDVCKFKDSYNSTIFGHFFKFFPLKGAN